MKLLAPAFLVLAAVFAGAASAASPEAPLAAPICPASLGGFTLRQPSTVERTGPAGFTSSELYLVCDYGTSRRLEASIGVYYYDAVQPPANPLKLGCARVNDSPASVANGTIYSRTKQAEANWFSDPGSGPGAIPASVLQPAARSLLAAAEPAAVACAGTPGVAATTAATASTGPLACPVTLGGWSLRNKRDDPAYSAIVGRIFRITDVIAGAQGVTGQMLADAQGWFQLECQYRPPDPKLVPTTDVPKVSVAWAESGAGSFASFTGISASALCAGTTITQPDPRGADQTVITSRAKRAFAGYATGGVVSESAFASAARSLLAAAEARANACPGAAAGGVTAASGPPSKTAAVEPSDIETDLAAAIVEAAVNLAADTGVPVSTALVAVLAALLGIPGAAGAGAASAGAAAGPTALPEILDAEGKPMQRWEPGKYGADRDGRLGQPGDIWYGGRWLSEPRVQEELVKDRAAHAQEAADASAFTKGTDDMRARAEAQHDAERRAGFESIEARDAWRASQAAAERQAREEAERSARDEIRALDDAIVRGHTRMAELERQEANIYAAGQNFFEGVQFIADTSLSILKQYTGPPGRLVAQIYAGVKQGAGDAFDPSKSWSDVASGALWASGKAVAGDVLQDVAQPRILQPITEMAFSRHAPIASAAQWFTARVTFNPQLFDLVGDMLSGKVVDAASQAADAETWLSSATSEAAGRAADAVGQATDAAIDAVGEVLDPPIHRMYGL